MGALIPCNNLRSNTCIKKKIDPLLDEATLEISKVFHIARSNFRIHQGDKGSYCGTTRVILFTIHDPNSNSIKSHERLEAR